MENKARVYRSKILDELLANVSPSLEKWVNSTMIISVLIDEAMKKKNFSVEDTAKLFKVSSETIRNWMGGSYNFTLKQLCNIEEKLEINLFHIVKYIKDASPEDYAKIKFNDNLLEYSQLPTSILNIAKNMGFCDDEEIVPAKFITKILERYFKMGYHRRMDGSITESENLICDTCGKKTTIRVGFEKMYPEFPDLGLCGECAEEFIKMSNNVLLAE